MDVKPLPQTVRSKIRNGTNINNITQCVTELVLNSLDAKSTAISVRVNLQTYKIEVIDNGSGITKTNFKYVGVRFMTNKCKSLEDLKNVKYFGFRGEALASIKGISKRIQITSKPENIHNTYTKTCHYGKWSDVIDTKERSNQGTTITIEDFMCQLPVRQKRINPNLDLENIKQMIESLAIIHPKISFSVRNDIIGKVIFKSSKTKSVSQALTNLYHQILEKDLVFTKVSKDNISVSGLLSKVPNNNKKLQYIYLNKRLISVPKIKNLINSLLVKKFIFHNKETTSKHRNRLEHPIYVINIRCPFSEVDLLLSPSKKNVEFKNLDLVLACIKKVVATLFDKNQCVDNTNDEKINLIEDNSIKNDFGISEIKDAVTSPPFKRCPEKTISDIEEDYITKEQLKPNSLPSKFQKENVETKLYFKDKKSSDYIDDENDSFFQEISSSMNERSISVPIFSLNQDYILSDKKKNIEIEYLNKHKKKQQTDLCRTKPRKLNGITHIEKYKNRIFLKCNQERGTDFYKTFDNISEINIYEKTFHLPNNILTNEVAGKQLLLNKFFNSIKKFPNAKMHTKHKPYNYFDKPIYNETNLRDIKSLQHNLFSKNFVPCNPLQYHYNRNNANIDNKCKKTLCYTIKSTKSTIIKLNNQNRLPEYSFYHKPFNVEQVEVNALNFTIQASEFTFPVNNCMERNNNNQCQDNIFCNFNRSHVLNSIHNKKLRHQQSNPMLHKKPTKSNNLFTNKNLTHFCQCNVCLNIIQTRNYYRNICRCNNLPDLNRNKCLCIKNCICYLTCCCRYLQTNGCHCNLTCNCILTNKPAHCLENNTTKYQNLISNNTCLKRYNSYIPMNYAENIQNSAGACLNSKCFKKHKGDETVVGSNLALRTDNNNNLNTNRFKSPTYFYTHEKKDFMSNQHQNISKTSKYTGGLCNQNNFFMNEGTFEIKENSIKNYNTFNDFAMHKKNRHRNYTRTHDKSNVFRCKKSNEKNEFFPVKEGEQKVTSKQQHLDTNMEKQNLNFSIENDSGAANLNNFSEWYQKNAHRLNQSNNLIKKSKLSLKKPNLVLKNTFNAISLDNCGKESFTTLNTYKNFQPITSSSKVNNTNNTKNRDPFFK